MTLMAGNILEGTVVNITNFGAFVEIEGKTGLVHISEVADSFVKDIRQHLNEQDKVKVKVISIDDNGKISLSIRKAVDKPQVTETKSRPQKTFNKDARASTSSRPSGGGKNRYQTKKVEPQKDDFDSLLSGFLKDSEDRLVSLKRSTEGKRGGRGGRRN